MQADLLATASTFLQWPPLATTGVDDIDFWIGGLAEKQMPFGGLLGSTFNFVFENQMEKLQNGDRFYYLERTAGAQLLHRAREQLVRQIDHGEHRYDAPAGRRLLHPGLHSRGRPGAPVHGSRP